MKGGRGHYVGRWEDRWEKGGAGGVINGVKGEGAGTDQ